MTKFDPTKPLCEFFEPYIQEATFSGGATGDYLSVVHWGSPLPKETDLKGNHHLCVHGYAVDYGYGKWLFFKEKNDAIAFGEAARKSRWDCQGYTIYQAAQLWGCICPDREHRRERVLLLKANVKNGGDF